MKMWLVGLGIIALTACAKIPVGVGHRIHICGTIVDEKFNVIKDTLEISTRTEYPLLDLSGSASTTEGSKTITNGKFCVDAYNAIGFTAHVNGRYVNHSHLSVLYKSLNIPNFKWVIERNTDIEETPKFDIQHYLSIEQTGKMGYSTIAGRVFVKDSADGEVVAPEWLSMLLYGKLKLKGEKEGEKLKADWEEKFPNTLSIIPQQHNPVSWWLSNKLLLVDYFLKQKADSLFIHSGPVSQTKLMIASIDSPVCNFGRLSFPKETSENDWKDSILVAVNDSLVVDVFFLNYPKFGRIGKVILGNKIFRDSTKLIIPFVQIIKEKKVSKSLQFWSLTSDDFYNRKGCLTPVEKIRTLEPYKVEWQGD